MTHLIFATGNPHKIKEVHELLNGLVEVKGLRDIGCPQDLPETSPTIAGNALQKARFVRDHFEVNCFSEDTGLEIDSLGGEPGVLSARYAGDEKDAEANMQLVLRRLEGVRNRRARFRTVVALMLDGREYTFEGVAEGEIRTAKSGDGGFGYDPIFQPEGYPVTFAEMDSATKNAISHRGKAIRLLINFLKKRNHTKNTP